MKVERVGVVGLGSVGREVATRFSRHGIAVQAYDRRHDPDAASCGARTVRLPADAAEDADLVLVTMPDEHSAEEVLFDHGGIGETLPDGRYVIDASDVGPGFSRSATERLAALGLHRVQIAVLLRSDPSSDVVRLVAAGTRSDLAAVQPALELISADIHYLGAVSALRHKVRHHRGTRPVTAPTLPEACAR